MLDTAEDVDSIGRAVKQLSTIIENWIKHSLGDSAYDKAVEAIGVMRKECIEMEEPGLYNDAMKNLKGKIVGEELGGERGEMWWKIRSNKLGLIDNKISPVSEVDEEEAKAVSSSSFKCVDDTTNRSQIVPGCKVAVTTIWILHDTLLTAVYNIIQLLSEDFISYADKHVHACFARKKKE